MKQLILIFFLLYTFNGYSQKDTLKIEREYWDNGKFKSVKVYSNLYYYSYTNWYKNGQKATEGSITEKLFINNSWDTLGNKLVIDGEGYHINFYETGEKKESGIIHDGLYSGIWTEYYSNGQKKARGAYKIEEENNQGCKYGMWVFWDEKGTKTEEVKYTNNILEYWNGWDKNGKQLLKNGSGYLEQYYTNRKLKAAGEIKNGKKWGNWREWYSNGKIREEYKYDVWPSVNSDTTFYKFVLINSWDSTNFQTAKNGTGWHYEYNDLNQLSYKSFYLNGVRDSVSVSYYPNGRQFVVDKYNNGNWTYRTIYHDNGNKAYEYSRAFGYNQDGIVKTWYFNGKLMLEELYNQGRLMDKTKYDKNGRKEFEFKN
jgi:antitoxin component YwqK of YwqJK toxin-antitoxin module